MENERKLAFIEWHLLYVMLCNLNDSSVKLVLPYPSELRLTKAKHPVQGYTARGGGAETPDRSVCLQRFLLCHLEDKCLCRAIIHQLAIWKPLASGGVKP